MGKRRLNARRVIFVDTDIFIYAVGRPHPLREPARTFFAACNRDRFPSLGGRDLCHLACCRRRGVGDIKTFDRALAAVSGKIDEGGA